MTRIAPYLIVAVALSLSACTNPYDPVQRGLGGGILGAASGAAIGAAAGGGPGAALGAAIGGATGIFGGVASTPPSPPGTYYGYPAYGYPGYGYPGYAQPGYGYPGYSGYPAHSGPPGYGYPGYSGQPAYPGSPSYGYLGYSGQPGYPAYSYSGSPVIPPTPVLRAMATKAVRYTLLIPVPDIPWLVIRAIAPWRSGLLGPSTLSSLLAEFRPKSILGTPRRSDERPGGPVLKGLLG